METNSAIDSPVSPVSPASLRSALSSLADIRQRLAAAEATRDAFVTPEFSAAVSAVSAINKDISIAEAVVRNQAIQVYSRGGLGKTDLPGVTITEVKEPIFEYDDRRVVDWIIEHGFAHQYLSLDARNFESLVLATQRLLPWDDVVSVDSETVRGCRIARDLSAFLFVDPEPVGSSTEPA